VTGFLTRADDSRRCRPLGQFFLSSPIQWPVVPSAIHELEHRRLGWSDSERHRL